MIRLPVWLEPWKWWLLAIPAVLLAVVAGFALVARPGRPPALESRGGLRPEDLEASELARIEEMEVELLEADAELVSALEEPDLDTRSDALASLLARRR